jgi:hypothetical protein
VREDLAALTPETVTALANRGLVRRALKELAEGAAIGWEEGDDGTVVARLPEGVEVRLPPETSLKETGCTCEAPGMCRHRVLAALAYARRAGRGADPPAFVPWSPGDFDDATLQTRLGKRDLRRARALRRQGFAARVRRARPAHPTPAVELASTTVRFLVPGSLAFAKSDGDEEQGREAIALAVWAFREADRTAPDAPLVEVEVGEAVAVDAGLEPVLALRREILTEGIVHAREGVGRRFAEVRRGLRRRRLLWMATALAELEDQLSAYRSRHARYRPTVAADRIAELEARARASRGGALPTRRVLGLAETMRTALDHLRLVALGARVDGEGRARVFLADPDTAMVLVWEKQWAAKTGEAAPTGPALATRAAVGRARLDALARGQVVSASAERRASRMVELKGGRLARTRIGPSRGTWEELPEPLRVRDVARFAEDARLRPPRVLRPRVLAEDVHVVAVSEVVSTAYAPGPQELRGVARDATGGAFAVRLAHRPEAPGALPQLARALQGELGELRFLSGELRRGRGGVELEPFAAVCDTRVEVFDLAPEGALEALPLVEDAPPPDPVGEALAEAAERLAEAAHRGLAHLPAGYAARLADAARRLGEVGLEGCEEALVTLTSRLGRAEAADAWSTAYLRVRIAEEQR